MAKLGFKIKFTKSVFGATQRAKIKKEILQAVESSPEYRKEIARVFQMANRRIQNIEQSGQLSPAVQALNKGDVKGFTKFSMKGDWNTLKIEYGKAISFLRQPTSTAQGARQYGQHMQRMYDLTPDEYNLMARELARQVKQRFGQRLCRALFDAVQGFHGRNGAKRKRYKHPNRK